MVFYFFDFIFDPCSPFFYLRWWRSSRRQWSPKMLAKIFEYQISPHLPGRYNSNESLNATSFEVVSDEIFSKRYISCFLLSSTSENAHIKEYMKVFSTASLVIRYKFLGTCTIFSSIWDWKSLRLGASRSVSVFNYFESRGPLPIRSASSRLEIVRELCVNGCLESITSIQSSSST